MMRKKITVAYVLNGKANCATVAEGGLLSIPEAWCFAGGEREAGGQAYFRFTDIKPSADSD